ncbi:MAG TPA: class I lanthipeptide [Chitinophaga sp.]|uniref:class I lanthipeptide n=1 Tax=Chitinophaga sp. TaxID=1869181 RepID=UPI002B610164|nr:class I lanthipeptide [Chitinophaga sp.]HVI43532.1 class I lanthipeptide [Chitinophaga sp.]
MKTKKTTLNKKLVLQKEPVAGMNYHKQTDIVEGPVAVSAPFHTSPTMASPARCYPCCDLPFTGRECYN